MKKIGIVTINGNNNYGNRLQNYALEQSVKALGCEPVTIVIKERKSLRNHLGDVRRVLFADKRKKIMRAKMNAEKKRVFTPFTRDYLNNVMYKYKDDFNDFYRIIAGSDQVWNPNFGVSPINFLRFVPKEKRYSYAASIATEIVPKRFVKKFTKYLSEMQELSVREKSSLHLIKTLTDREAILSVDPTMLLSKNDWLNLVDKSHTNVSGDKPYILIYSLISTESKILKLCNKYADEYGCEIRTIMGNYFNPEHLVYSPIEFIDAVNKAQIVITDSFHCCVFSIIMHTPFLVFERTDYAKMSSRIQTLLHRFNFDSNFYTFDTNLNDIINTDFSEVDGTLHECCKDGISYLRKITL